MGKLFGQEQCYGGNDNKHVGRAHRIVVQLSKEDAHPEGEHEKEEGYGILQSKPDCHL